MLTGRKERKGNIEAKREKRDGLFITGKQRGLCENDSLNIDNSRNETVVQLLVFAGSNETSPP